MLFRRTLRNFFATKNTVKLTWVNPEGQETTVPATEGETLLENAHKNGIDLEGACEGSLACSTCHVVLEENIYDSREEPTADEEDMLDLAFGLTPTSRLGCQIKVTPDMDRAKITLPAGTVNMYVDGHKPKPH